ncbi:MAG: type VI secretion system baseplate subunit TssE [Pyrinomonadaceae bacterium]
MSRFDNHVRVSTSVLDRLIDLDPRESQEAPKSQSASLTELKQAVRRDLEWLLNTRCFAENVDGGLEETLKSVAFYGLPDFTATSVTNQYDQDRMRQAIETALKNFEPRFSGVKVILEPISNVDRTLKFRIEATLEIDPYPEPVVFDTVLQLGTGNFAIQGGS